jgi:Mor family transcriptional regulator
MSQAVPQTVMTFPDGYPELLEQMGQIIGAELLTLGLPLSIANAKALSITNAIRREVGGQQLYVSKGLEYDLSLRDEEIYAAFRGNNYDDLARRFSLTTVQIRNIVRKGQLRDQARRQNKLFD